MRTVVLAAVLTLVPPLSAQPTSANVMSDTVSLRQSRVQHIRFPDGSIVAYERPKFLQSVRNVPRDLGRVSTSVVRRKSLPGWGLVLGSTALLIVADQQLVNEAQRFGRRINLSTDHKTTDLFTVPLPFSDNEFPVRGPSTFSSALYFLGDGWSSVLTAGTFLTYGHIKHDNRALRTASEITESLLGVGVVAQVMKHSFGRQTPSSATVPRGRWDPFPSLEVYNANVPNYDAYPSGHLASVMGTVTVIAENYPEKKWVRPVGYGVMSVLAFTMMNNGVHWASDYPIALAIGNAFGRLAVKRGRTVVTPAP